MAEIVTLQELSIKETVQRAYQKQEAKPLLPITSLHHPLLTKFNVVPADFGKNRNKGPRSLFIKQAINLEVSNESVSSTVNPFRYSASACILTCPHI